MHVFTYHFSALKVSLAARDYSLLLKYWMCLENLPSVVSNTVPNIDAEIFIDYTAP